MLQNSDRTQLRSDQQRVRRKHSGWERPARAIVRSNSTAISSRSSTGKLSHLGVEELRIQELVRARKPVIKKVGTDDNPAVV